MCLSTYRHRPTEEHSTLLESNRSRGSSTTGTVRTTHLLYTSFLTTEQSATEKRTTNTSTHQSLDTTDDRVTVRYSISRTLAHTRQLKLQASQTQVNIKQHK